MRLLHEICEHNKNQLEDNKHPVVIAFHVLGEPMLNPNIFEYLDICEKLGLVSHLITNTTTLTHEITKKLMGYTLLNFQLSFHSVDEDSWKERKYKNLSFAQFRDQIFNFIEAKFKYGSPANIHVHVGAFYDAFNYKIKSDSNIGIMPGNFDDSKQKELWFDSFAKELEALRNRIESKYEQKYLAQLQKFPIQPSNDDNLSFLNLLPRVIITLKDIGLWNRSNDFVKSVFPNHYVYNEESSYTIPCGINGNLSILSDGTACACCIDYEGATNLGNLNETTLSKVLKSNKLARIRDDASFLDVCRKCSGTLFVFEKSPLKQATQNVLYGNGFVRAASSARKCECWQLSSKGYAYVYTRIVPTKYNLRVSASSACTLEVGISEYNNETEKFNRLYSTQFSVLASDCDISDDFAFLAGKFYRLEFDTSLNGRRNIDLVISAVSVSK